MHMIRNLESVKNTAKCLPPLIPSYLVAFPRGKPVTSILGIFFEIFHMFGGMFVCMYFPHTNGILYIAFLL